MAIHVIVVIEICQTEPGWKTVEMIMLNSTVYNMKVWEISSCSTRTKTDKEHQREAKATLILAY